MVDKYDREIKVEVKLKKNQIERFVLNSINLDANQIESIESCIDDDRHILAKVKLITPSNNTSILKVTLLIKRFTCPKCHCSFSDDHKLAFNKSRVLFAVIQKIMDPLKSTVISLIYLCLK